MMGLDIGSIINTPGKALPFELSIDLSDMEFGGQLPVTEPLRVRGRIRNEAGVLIITAHAETELHFICDRCAGEFNRRKDLEIEAVLAGELSDEENDDHIYLLEGDKVNVTDIVTTEFVLSMEPKLLCDEECRGICPGCGENLNEGTCTCKPQIDPRLEALKGFLK